MNPKLEETKLALAKSDFAVEAVQALDEAHSGNWTLVASRGPLAVRISTDRADIQIDLMPYHRFEPRLTWEACSHILDVVPQALGLPIATGGDRPAAFLLPASLCG